MFPAESCLDRLEKISAVKAHRIRYISDLNKSVSVPVDSYSMSGRSDTDQLKRP